MNQKDYKILKTFVNNPHDYISLLNPTNEFIVVTLAKKVELHIWSECISKSHYIQNYNWVSINKVLYGTLWQYPYSILPYTNPTHELYDFDTLKPINAKIPLQQRRLINYVEGKQYLYNSGQYHITWNQGNTCSLVSFIGTYESQFTPKIATRIGTTPKQKLNNNLHPSAIPLIVESASIRIKEKLRSLYGDKSKRSSC